MLDVYLTNAFKKDAKKSKKQGKPMHILDEVVTLLRKGHKLPVKYRDHRLIGNYKNCRECHLNPDWLLIYEVMDSQLVLHRLGSHSELY